MRTIQQPRDLADFFKDPQRIRDAIDLLNAISNLQGVLEIPGTNNSLGQGKGAIVGDVPALMLRFPFKNSAAIANPATTTAANTAAIISLLTWGRTVGFIPT